MTVMVKKSADHPDETRHLPQDAGDLQVVDLEGTRVGRATYQPGWRWTQHMKAIAGTDHCEAHHVGYVVSGTITVQMIDEDEEITYRAGDFMAIPPGHDAWVVGDQPCVLVDWVGLGAMARSDA